MSGIVGIWNLDGRPVEHEVFTRMSATLAHRGPDGEGLWIEGAVGLSCQLMRVTPESLTERQPLVHSSGSVIVFDGRLDNRAELLTSLKGSTEISADSPDPAMVLAAYEVFGDRFPERLNGDFALGLFDPRRQQLFLVRDAIGVRPLYYCRAGDTVLFASEIKAILAHPKVSTRPNDDMLAALLLGEGFRHCHGMTFFDGVSSLIPGHLVIANHKEFVTQQYWDFDPKGKVRLGSFKEYAHAFREVFEQAVRRRLRSAYPIAVFVSGGLDSSSILCLAQTLRTRAPGSYQPLLGISYISPDGSPSDEKSLILDIERQYDLKITRIPYGPLDFLKGSKEQLRRMEAPFLRAPQNTADTFHDIIHQHGARVLLTGHYGDHMLASQEYLIDLFRNLEWRKVFVQLNEYGRWYNEIDPSYFRRDFIKQLVKYHVPDVLYTPLRKLRATLAGTTPTRSLYSRAFRNRARVSTSSKTPPRRRFTTAYANSIYELVRSWYYVQWMEWSNKITSIDGVEMSYPFLDRDLVSFLLGIPGEIQTWKGVPKSILREAMKEVLPDTIRKRRWKAGTTDLVNETMENEYAQLIRCLESDGMALRSGYLDGNVVMKELKRLKSRIRGASNDVTWSLGDLLGLELWLQVFFGQESIKEEILDYATTK